MLANDLELKSRMSQLTLNAIYTFLVLKGNSLIPKTENP